MAQNTNGSSADGSGGTRHLQRSGLYLLVNTAATGGLGTLFWLLAARYSTQDDVAAAVAAASILISAAYVCQLNLPTALSRYLPAAGPGQATMVREGYSAALLASVAAGAGVVVVGLIRGGAVVDGGSLLLTVALAVSVPVWVVFALQDSVLVTLRASHWVPVENVLTTVAKYGLLPLLVGLGGGAGILIAWTAPALAGVAVVTVYLFRTLLAGGAGGTVPAAVPGRRQLLVYAMRDFPGGAMQLLSLRLVPLLVLEIAGRRAGANVGLPWTILTVAVLVLPMLSRALLSELSQEDADVEALMARARALVLLGLVPATVVGTFLVEPLLSIAGPQYADQGTPILLAGILGIGPAAYIECRLAELRFDHRVGATGAFQAGTAVVLIAAVCVLLVTDRTAWIGVAFLVVNVAAALAVSVLARRPGPSADRDGAAQPWSGNPRRSAGPSAGGGSVNVR